MITNFETITADLTEKQLLMVPYLVGGFKNHLKGNPIKAPEIVDQCNTFFKAKEMDLHMTEPVLRKCVNYIRLNAMIPLIATSEGYYVSWDKEDIRNQIKSLRERANSITLCADGMEKFLF
jgi:hypothetical protein